MKKLMFVTAFAATAALWADGFESANTVGYTQSYLTGDGQDIAGTPFVSIGGSAFSIQNLTFSDSTDAKNWITVYNSSAGKYDKAIYWDEIYETLEPEEPMGSGWG